MRGSRCPSLMELARAADVDSIHLRLLRTSPGCAAAKMPLPTLLPLQANLLRAALQPSSQRIVQGRRKSYADGVCAMPQAMQAKPSKMATVVFTSQGKTYIGANYRFQLEALASPRWIWSCGKIIFLSDSVRFLLTTESGHYVLAANACGATALAYCLLFARLAPIRCDRSCVQ